MMMMIYEFTPSQPRSYLRVEEGKKGSVGRKDAFRIVIQIFYNNDIK